MGVYVFDMEMPRSCNECRFSVNGFCRASPKLAVGAAMSNRERTNYCPLVYAPPHGRLIDADALHYNRIRIAHPDGVIGGWNAVVMSAEIKDAPTIIPADPEKEEDHVNPG